MVYLQGGDHRPFLETGFPAARFTEMHESTLTETARRASRCRWSVEGSGADDGSVYFILVFSRVGNDGGMLMPRRLKSGVRPTIAHSGKLVTPPLKSNNSANKGASSQLKVNGKPFVSTFEGPTWTDN
ncbi:uncharacterized protein F4807DRAFT_458694 [Annulohypoxylon truncatum]|uniref:uncharacterized protein n=1 Tax=Annulohypoxylon truncatum TaxID=327061 RepID=UPI0020087DBD|nr:uncharacterized protein F4807DRAFT_458694 [Annulohypoxylon truncatum]KAI1211121.1 hypothetical protein F4807DRAFT_458694 [Annulohypoxylon truncatum]